MMLGNDKNIVVIVCEDKLVLHCFFPSCSFFPIFHNDSVSSIGYDLDEIYCRPLSGGVFSHELEARHSQRRLVLYFMLDLLYALLSET